MPEWNTKRRRALEGIGHEPRYKKFGKKKSQKIKSARRKKHGMKQS